MLLRTQSDERLVDLTRAGQDGAFEAIVARYRGPLVRYCAAILSEARSEDAVQLAFLRAYDALRSSEGEMQLRAWLYRIAHNTALNELRDGLLDHDQLDATIDRVERPDQAFERHQSLRDVVAAVGMLPTNQRDAIVLREFEGRSYEEIPTELGVTGGSVRMLLNRARTTLRDGATVVAPFGLLTRIPWNGADGAVATRVAELCTAGAGGAMVVKVCATALVTGAVVAGVAVPPGGGPDRAEGFASGEARAALASKGADRERIGRAEPGGRSRAQRDAAAPGLAERRAGGGSVDRGDRGERGGRAGERDGASGDGDARDSGGAGDDDDASAPSSDDDHSGFGGGDSGSGDGGDGGYEAGSSGQGSGDDPTSSGVTSPGRSGDGSGEPVDADSPDAGDPPLAALDE